MSSPPTEACVEPALRATRAWVEHTVIGLNLCPFAKAVQTRGLIRYVGCAARDTVALSQALREELLRLRDTPIEQIETTLLVHAGVLQDFADYNDFLDEADALLAELDLVGVLQVASFHPQYRFAGTDADDIGNATNRSPHPCLHLLREASIERAVASFPEPEAIYGTNMRTLRALGTEGWAALQAACLRGATRSNDT
jgi:hypothetical protein